jgi:hypothetical protein
VFSGFAENKFSAKPENTKPANRVSKGFCFEPSPNGISEANPHIL